MTERRDYVTAWRPVPWTRPGAASDTCSTGGIEVAIEQATAAAGVKDVAHLRLCVKRSR